MSTFGPHQQTVFYGWKDAFEFVGAVDVREVGFEEVYRMFADGPAVGEFYLEGVLRLRRTEFQQ